MLNRTSHRIGLHATLWAAAIIFLGFDSSAEFIALKPSADTTLFQTDPNNNLGGFDTMSVGTTAAGFFSRALVKFDMAGKIPARSTIISVKLAVSALKGPTSGGKASVVELHRVRQDWGEGVQGGNPRGAVADDSESTWISRFHPDAAWSKPGAASPGDFDPVSSAMFNVSALARYEVGSNAGLISDVQSWLTNAAANFGWILLCQNENTLETARRYGSREHATDRPILMVEFKPPGLPPPTRLMIEQTTPVGFTLSFQAEPRAAYILEQAHSPASTNWTILTNFGVQLVNGRISVTNVFSGGQRYLRVVTIE